VYQRMNRTLIESARSMMSHANLPKDFWAEAVNTATFIRNRVTYITCPIYKLKANLKTVKLFCLEI
jgi:hypothetical protein